MAPLPARPPRRRLLRRGAQCGAFRPGRGQKRAKRPGEVSAPRRTSRRRRGSGTRGLTDDGRNQFEVRVTTPPPRSLGIHALEDRADGLVGCGEEIEVQGQSFVVDQVVKRYELRRGKYVRSHSRLDVQPSGRYFLNRQLEGLLEGEDADKGPDGAGAER